MSDDAIRRAQLAKLHIGAKELGWDDATYRDVLERFTGKRSAGKLTEQERRIVLDHMREQGFENKARKPHKMADDPVAEIRRTMTRAEDEAAHHAFIRAMWKWLSDHGALYDPFGLEGSLDNFVYRQTGIALLKWLPPDKSAAVAEGLKKWVYRVHKRPPQKAAP